jgi:hypothetical protein
MSKYTPTMREKIAGLLAKNLYGDSREGYRKAERLVNVGETVVPPLGLMTGMYDAGRAAGGGNIMQAGVLGGLAAMPLPPAVKKGIRAYHGSPHSFDKFSMDKIGTGEGAQAYGHGLYFAEGEGVAKSYRDALAPIDVNNTADGAPISHDLQRMIGDSFQTLQGRTLHNPEVKDALDLVDDALMRQRADAMKARDMEWFNQIEDLRNESARVRKSPPQKRGHMYEVNIDADPEQFLDWDKPLSEQPESIKKAYESYLTTPAARRADKSLGGAIARKEGQFANPTGKDFYGAVYEATPSIGTTERAKVTKTLQQAGIPGIKYLDAGSRAKGDGSRNYVVFDEKLISIVRKYGIAGASTMLGYDILSNVTDDQAKTLQQAERVY